MNDIRVTFILPKDATDERDASQDMLQAYETCKQLVDNIKWAHESELSQLKLDKLDYIVVESFEGKDFSEVIQSKSARIVGLMAVSVCLMEGKSIPSFQWPVLNVTMYGYEVTCSQMSKGVKEAIKDKVQLMGGLYNKNFTSSVTHVICNETKSETYMLTTLSSDSSLHDRRVYASFSYMSQSAPKTERSSKLPKTTNYFYPSMNCWILFCVLISL